MIQFANSDYNLSLLVRSYRVFLVSGLVLFCIGVPFLFVRKAATALGLLILIGTLCYCWYLALRGKHKASLLLFATILWLVLIGLLYLGMSAATMGVILPVSMLLAVIVSQTAALIYGFSFLLAWLGYVVLTHFNLEPPHYFAPRMLVNWFINAICFWLTLMPISSLIAEMRSWIRVVEQDAERRVGVESELRIAVANAVEATEIKSQFLANMSHEIRTPMNAILGLLKLLQMTDLTPRQRDYGSKIGVAARSLLVLLNDILDFSKAEAGKMTLSSEPFSLDQMMAEVSVILSSTLTGRYIEVVFSIDSDLPAMVIGDLMRLKQVLINLGGNAIKFTPKGLVVVSLQRVAVTTETVVIKFSVQDTGIGISSENLDHIFQGFSQAEESTTRRFGGSGLGLAISDHFIGLMGGQIKVDSTPGVGSVFWFQLDLPLIAVKPDEPHDMFSFAAMGQSLLVVDDSPMAGPLIQEMIQTGGREVVLATSGEQALELITSRLRQHSSKLPFPVIFLDGQMAGLSGWQTRVRIRELAHHHNLPQPTIILMSTHGDELSLVGSEVALDPKTGFVVKPLTKGMLIEAVRDTRQLSPNKPQPVRNKPLVGLNVLVVEDNLINQQVVTELLISAGASVKSAVNGQLGVAAVAKENPQFDAVLMDIQMPELDGYGATRRIRQELGLKMLPIIAMTANALASDRAACLAADMTEHVPKPFDLEHLVSVLLKVTGTEAENIDGHRSDNLLGGKRPT
jgi:two-component system sensor histidine kinase/response regulator